MDAIKVTKMPAGPVSIAFLGVAFARVWLTLVFIEPSTGVAAPPLSHEMFDVGYVALSLACALGARRIVVLSQSKGWYIAALLAMLLASTVWICSVSLALPAVVGHAAACIGGAAYGVFLLLNAEAFAGLGILRVVLYLSGSRVLASIMTFFLGEGGLLRTGAALLILPCIAVWLVYVSYRSLDEVDRQRSSYPKYSFPWKLIALVGVFSFAYGLRQASLVAGAGQHSSLSTALVMGAVFLAAYLFSDKIDVAHLCRLPLPIMLCGLLLIPAEGVFGLVASSYLVSIAYTLMTFLVSILLYDMAKHTGVSIVPLMGAANAMQAFVVLGNITAQSITSIPDTSIGKIITSVLVVTALAISFFLLFSERELASRWGIHVLEGASLGEEAKTAAMLSHRCDELVKTYKLTAREEEVLHELAQGKSNYAIAQDLLIAPGTLKAHTRHIYEKMGIHTRSELNLFLNIEEGSTL